MNTRLVGNKEIVTCPGCQKSRPASPGFYICGKCGAEFVEER